MYRNNLQIFKLNDTKLSSLCNKEDGTIIHLFANCPKSKTLWNSLKEFLKDTIKLPFLLPQKAIFGLLQTYYLIISYSKLSFTAI